MTFGSEPVMDVITERGSASVAERKTEATWKGLQTLKVIQI